MTEDEDRSARAFAALVFAVVAPVSYQLQRLYELARSRAVDHRLILASPHLGFVWRVVLSLWFALACAALAYRTRRARQPLSPADVRRWVLALTVLGAAFTLVAWRLP
jgi:hypothetical protein